MVVVMRAEKRLAKIQYDTSEQTHIEAKERELRTLAEFKSAECTDPFCDGV